MGRNGRGDIGRDEPGDIGRVERGDIGLDQLGDRGLYVSAFVCYLGALPYVIILDLLLTTFILEISDFGYYIALL